MTSRTLLTVGLDPALSTDFTKRLFPHLDPDTIRADLVRVREQLAAWGFAVESIALDLGETAESVLRDALARRRYDCVVVGAGVRLDPALSPLFEVIVNVLREAAPQAILCFNTEPASTPDAVARWFPVEDVQGGDDR